MKTKIQRLMEASDTMYFEAMTDGVRAVTATEYAAAKDAMKTDPAVTIGKLRAALRREGKRWESLCEVDYPPDVLEFRDDALKEIGQALKP